MLTLTETLSALTQAEKIVQSHRLKDDEKITLLSSLHNHFDLLIPGLPCHVIVARDAIARMIANERRDAPGTVGKPKVQGRKAKGVKESPEVDAGRTEEGSEAPKGETERVSDQAEDD